VNLKSADKGRLLKVANWIKDRNASPKPFIWTTKADAILAKTDRTRNMLE
jgi:hypothetical protein